MSSKGPYVGGLGPSPRHYWEMAEPLEISPSEKCSHHHGGAPIENCEILISLSLLLLSHMVSGLTLLPDSHQNTNALPQTLSHKANKP